MEFPSRIRFSWLPAICAIVGFLFFTVCARAQIPVTILHRFSSGDAFFANGSMTQVGSTLYGTSILGGKNDGGTVYKINTDGSNYSLLAEFDANAKPQGTLVASGSTLYGTTYSGLVYKLNMDGTGFKMLANVPSFPVGGLVISGSTLYGTNAGTIFKVNTDGTSFATIHTFHNDEGWDPEGDLAISGTTIYGTTSQGGVGVGTIFKINTDGSGFADLHLFGNSDPWGATPYTGVTISGSTLFGVTSSGGNGDGTADGIGGTVYKMDLDGNNFQVLHSFSYDSTDGFFPYGGVTVVDNVVYGTTRSGGANDNGIVFQMDVDGNNYQLLHQFPDSDADGHEPTGKLLLDGNILYGNTLDSIFSLPVPEPRSEFLAILACVSIAFARRRLLLNH